MKKILFATLSVVLCSICAICFLGRANADDSGTATINVIMTGFKSDTGKARVALVNDEKSFHSEDIAPFSGAVVEIKNGRATHTFKDVPYGEYAVKFFHDEDESGKLKTGAFGKPKEEYGFSNNIASKNYKKAKFQVNSPSLTLDLSTH